MSMQNNFKVYQQNKHILTIFDDFFNTEDKTQRKIIFSIEKTQKMGKKKMKRKQKQDLQTGKESKLKQAYSQQESTSTQVTSTDTEYTQNSNKKKKRQSKCLRKTQLQNGKEESVQEDNLSSIIMSSQFTDNQSCLSQLKIEEKERNKDQQQIQLKKKHKRITTKKIKKKIESIYSLKQFQVDLNIEFSDINTQKKIKKQIQKKEFNSKQSSQTLNEAIVQDNQIEVKQTKMQKEVESYLQPLAQNDAIPYSSQKQPNFQLSNSGFCKRNVPQKMSQEIHLMTNVNKNYTQNNTSSSNFKRPERDKRFQSFDKNASLKLNSNLAKTTFDSGSFKTNKNSTANKAKILPSLIVQKNISHKQNSNTMSPLISKKQVHDLVQKQQLKEEEDFEELIRTKYNIDNDAFMKMGYKERNQKLYEMLKQYQICVIPEVENIDNLPFFSIIETSLKDMTKKSKLRRQETDLRNSPERRKSKPIQQGNSPSKKAKHRQTSLLDPKNFKGNVELFRHLNELTSAKLKNKIEQSESINVQKRRREGKTLDQLKQEVEQLKQEVPDRLKEHIKKRFISQARVSVGNMDQIMDLKNSDRFDSFVGFQDLDSLNTQVHLPLPRKGSGQGKELEAKNETSSQQSTRKLYHRFREALRRKVRMHVENEQLKTTYMHEKRKLEMYLLRENQKIEVTQKILGMIESDQDSPKPNYRFEQIKHKFKEYQRDRRKLLTKGGHGSMVSVEDLDGSRVKDRRHFINKNQSISGELLGVQSDNEGSELEDRFNQDQVLDKIFFSKRNSSARKQTNKNSQNISEAIGKGLKQVLHK
ncbi:UNKNOWN [Stylonychia lemnae]|uniref:Uncharacterized protein n=1 Tax=Stylonychia lemnae TaxID=5949 RepID=A0A078B071_STYLE|nr:UNKNOWN [Stylonychia lemnae]|eukprot:CDW86812.1 UNKNOWN [Stylonychia lemnae]